MGKPLFWGVLGCLVLSVVVLDGFALPNAASAPHGCKKVTFTADGGYYSMGHFYPQPGDDVTVVTKWCYSHNRITSQSVRYTTNIPSSLSPQLSKHDRFLYERAVLDVLVVGTYDSNVINNTGLIGVSGRVTARGFHHFVNASGAGG